MFAYFIYIFKSNIITILYLFFAEPNTSPTSERTGIFVIHVQVGNQYPSSTSIRHGPVPVMLVVLFTSITLSNRQSLSWNELGHVN